MGKVDKVECTCKAERIKGGVHHPNCPLGKDRSDYFHGDMDAGGVRVTPPTENWEEE